MAGVVRGYTRRSHIKSRKGCETCKRRHIRCDEDYPQCRNCTKHKVRCPYNEAQTTQTTCTAKITEVQAPEQPAMPESPDFMWTPQVEAAIMRWQTTGEFPFPSLAIEPPPLPHMYSVQELRLIYHFTDLYFQLSAVDAVHFTLWTRYVPTLVALGSQYSFVMDAVLAFSATHIAFLTGCPLVAGIACEHRCKALRSLHVAIGAFRRETSDGILGASLLLSWQTTDWSNLTLLQQGISTVVQAMESWKHESQFADFFTHHSDTIYAASKTTTSSSHTSRKSKKLRREGIQALEHMFTMVRKIEAHLKYHDGDTTQVRCLIGFLRIFRTISPSLPVSQKYERLQPFITWLFWMPSGYLQSHRGSPASLVVITYLYIIVLLMERLFPEVSSGYFGSLCALPIEELANRLTSLSAICASSGADAHWKACGTLIELTLNTIDETNGGGTWERAAKNASLLLPPPHQAPGLPAHNEYRPSPVLSGTSSPPYSVPGGGGGDDGCGNHYVGAPTSYPEAYSPAWSAFTSSESYKDPEEGGLRDVGDASPYYKME
ncbi:uncharacterized protein UV8b_03257 [Ustilaginoidea virens]|uniref:Zn(2)-C6 fungal-type domain-containing protein n=2 Tax=Ustilaginoidea virens TaxID=1159556 RepID=A0A8E5HP60_USTVR|nr:uncharacterized protein UV8b_03257 [Ustilaginoidea virens]QUC19016.1 hypothetical protein UV8b_03257 [Ustilaginoidea virens]